MSVVRFQRSRRHIRFGRSLGVIAITALVSLLATAIAIVSPATASAHSVSDLDGRVVYVINAATGRFLDGDPNGGVDQSRVPRADDKWSVEEVSPGVFALRNTALHALLDADGPKRDHDVNLSRKLESDTQWEVTELENGTYSLKNVEYGLWLDGDYEDEGYNVNLTSKPDEADAQWYIGFADTTTSELAGSSVLLVNAATGRFLSSDANVTDQAEVPKSDSGWYVEESAGAFTFRSIGRDRLLHGEGSDVSLLGEGGAASEWWLAQRKSGIYEIQNTEYALWLDGDYEDEGYNVDLTRNGHHNDAGWHIIVLDRDFDCIGDSFDSIDEILLCVDATDVFTHLNAFQAFADANGGVRASGTPGYDASADYVAGLMEGAGLSVVRQEFDFSLYTENAVELVAEGVALETQSVSFSESGTVDGTIVPVDLDLGLGNASTSGCEPEDFVGVDLTGTADIVLVQRGACAFSTKAINAQDAGAEAVIIFNQGNSPERGEIIGATLGAAVVGTIAIPVLDISYANGELLSTTTGPVQVTVDASTVTSTTENIIADMPGVNAGNVVMSGAHLDSVSEGPGVQDNGSGSSVILAIALALAENESYTPQNTLRFAWWGAEESGLIGSTEYIFNPDFGISDADYAALAGYLNFDMIASPNFIYGVYDADESTFAAPVVVPEGSAAIEDLFEAYYTIEGVPYDDTEFSGRSDYQAFIDVGIPAAGLFTGAEQLKTAEQAAIWGGIAGEQYDQCYHQACDTIENVSYEATIVNVDAVAYAIAVLAASTEAVNGVAGVAIGGQTPDQVVLDGPQGTFVGEIGGRHAPHYHGEID